MSTLSSPRRLARLAYNYDSQYALTTGTDQISINCNFQTSSAAILLASRPVSSPPNPSLHQEHHTTKAAHPPHSPPSLIFQLRQGMLNSASQTPTQAAHTLPSRASQHGLNDNCVPVRRVMQLNDCIRWCEVNESRNLTLSNSSVVPFQGFESCGYSCRFL